MTQPRPFTTVHPGLRLGKQVADLDIGLKSKLNGPRFAAIARSGIPDGYRLAYESRRDLLDRLPGVTLLARFRPVWTLAVGLGNASVLENGITLERLWGMPMIPGSSLKGLASAWFSDLRALQEEDEPLTPDHQKAFFGAADTVAGVNWHDAWLVPEQVVQPFVHDTLTAHHGAYYLGNAAPTGHQDPIPVSFLTATGTYLVAVQAPDRDWAVAAMQVLTDALETWGIGGKTNSDYGRMTRLQWETDWMVEHEATQTMQAEVDAERERLIAALPTIERQLEVKDPRILDNLEAWIATWEVLEGSARDELGRKIRDRFAVAERAYYETFGIGIRGYPPKKMRIPPTKRVPDFVRTSGYLAWLEQHPWRSGT